MGNQPDGKNLLITARQMLLDELLPVLPAQYRYTTMMIANAMGTAARELEAHIGPVPKADSPLMRFLNQADIRIDCEADSEAVLVGLIRKREIPEASQQQLVELLLSVTRSKLQISNPKYLYL